ncbi:MAG: chemotaxis protein CheD [Massilia sp.]|uniref:chemotaxis protein CheD n=1 Tax=Massilia sp. TaxID=1882437 RepID=UPI0019A1D7DB|nr:chemotaxis protein CheD [Oxalobacteraceae sp. CFBP 8761]MBD8626760.1 chemotaxis protein CheD [Oxalobacteraceae sp. CFBP 8753]MBD8723413.1 chemotaxis protein CheD [Oxalobacteraceae sp. CFBP 13708]
MSMQSLSHMSHVLSGQMQIGHGHQVLTALLGSCVGIGMIWRKQGRCGLAHCFLPDGVEAGEGSARYVSAAVPRLLAMMGVRREQYDEVDVVIAGGARMLNLRPVGGAVGTRNIEAARSQLSLRGLQVRFQDVGGSQGRRLSIDCDQQTFSVVRIAREQEALAA